MSGRVGRGEDAFSSGVINRLDETVVFHALDDATIASIARVQLRELQKRVRAMEIDIEISDAAVAELAKAGFRLNRGATKAQRS